MKTQEKEQPGILFQSRKEALVFIKKAQIYMQSMKFELVTQEDKFYVKTS